MKNKPRLRVFFAALCIFAVAALAAAALLPDEVGFMRRAEKKPYDDGGFLYSGTLRGGKFDGQGLVEYADGSVYEGRFKEGRFEGVGMFTSPDGWRFEGTFSGGAPVEGVFYADNDKTKLTVSEGHVTLEGAWNYIGALGAKGQRGAGTFTYADGAVYEGECKAGVAEGQGKYTDAKGKVIYDGEWKSGKYHGKGQFNAPNGSFSYAGQFFNGKFEGVGTLKKKDGTVLKGTWRMGWRVSK